jgi:TPR repeat protein
MHKQFFQTSRFLLLFTVLSLAAVSIKAAEPVTQSFSHTVYMQPYSKLRQAAEQGDAQAQYDLAYLYYKSGSDPEILGVKRSDRLAAHWYGEAAMQGHASAQYNMAVLHLQGHGVERDAIVAYAWLMQAAANGHEGSKELLAELDNLLNAGQIEEARAHSAALKVSKPRTELAQDD